jgi:hypothetical protein
LQQDKIWSELALGGDRQCNILFIFCRSPYSNQDFNNILLQLSINIVCAQHLEGGPEASLYFSHKGVESINLGAMKQSSIKITTIILLGKYQMLWV